jgi:1,4-dihydroxy-2-naphthoate octaprenyltransferase
MAAYNRLTARMALQLAAPHTWAASIGPSVFAVLATAQAGRPLALWRSILLIAACVLMQAAVNTFNDYADFISGTDRPEDNVAVNDATLVYENINPVHARHLGAAFLAAGAICGLAGSYPNVGAPLGVGVMGGLTVILYSAGPAPVSRLPLGEIVSGGMMGGLIPLGIAAAVDNRLHPKIVGISLPFVIGIGLIMMTNNGCDIEKDLAAGRRTLPALLGRGKAVAGYRLMVRVWLVSLAVTPVIGFGRFGLLALTLVWLLGHRAFTRLLHADLQPATRIAQMQGIVKANVLTSSACAAAAAAALLAEVTGWV